MSLLQKSVDALTAAAGWKKASPGADGVFRWMRAGFRCTLLCLWPRALPPCRGMPRIF